MSSSSAFWAVSRLQLYIAANDSCFCSTSFSRVVVPSSIWARIARLTRFRWIAGGPRRRFPVDTGGAFESAVGQDRSGLIRSAQNLGRSYPRVQTHRVKMASVKLSRDRVSLTSGIQSEIQFSASTLNASAQFASVQEIGSSFGRGTR